MNWNVTHEHAVFKRDSIKRVWLFTVYASKWPRASGHVHATMVVNLLPPVPALLLVPILLTQRLLYVNSNPGKWIRVHFLPFHYAYCSIFAYQNAFAWQFGSFSKGHSINATFAGRASTYRYIALHFQLIDRSSDQWLGPDNGPGDVFDESAGLGCCQPGL